MTVQRALFAWIGSLILIGVALTFWVSEWFLIIPAFVGLNVLQSAFTGWCPMIGAFKKLGLPSKPGDAVQA